MKLVKFFKPKKLADSNVKFPSKLIEFKDM